GYPGKRDGSDLRQPQRGCGLQPRVAVFGYPWKVDGSDLRQPQRGCGLQPRVAVFGYPGKRDGSDLRQPQRGCGLQPRVAVFGSPGKRDGSDLRQPQRGCGSIHKYIEPSRFQRTSKSSTRVVAATALRLLGRTDHISQGSRRRQPWAGGRNRFAVAATASRLPGSPLRLPTIRGCVTQWA